MPVHVFAGGGGRNISVNLPTVQHFDYGDAPEDNPQYPTLLSSDGARHHLNPSAGGFLLTLGTKVDTELDGQPSASASGDDAQGPFDDESGVAFVNSLQPGGMAEIEVWVSGDGHLDAWVDFNRNGSWLDPGEQIFQAMQVGPNLNILSFSVPALAVTGDTYARFRLSSNGMLAPTGSAPDGEVEDYLVTIGSSQNVATDWGDAGNGNTLQNGTASYPVA
ncbi:MAG: GEVED domain-containing protein, partial [Verrucomicrobiota bacterium]|nr:GEVED domain-containing protein [Verrucomicrobiota bacterium]